MITREFTNRLLDMVDQGMFDNVQLIQDLVGWMPEGDVKQFFHAYELDISALEEEEDEEDGEYERREAYTLRLAADMIGE